MPRVGKTVTGIDPVTKRFVSMTPEQFANELIKKSRKPPSRLSATVERYCELVRDTAKANVLQTAPVHNGNAYKYIDYEVQDDKTGSRGIVGYNRTYRPARLGNLLEFGGGGDHSPAHFDIARALETHQQAFIEKTLDDAEAYLESRFDPNGPR